LHEFQHSAFLYARESSVQCLFINRRFSRATQSRAVPFKSRCLNRILVPLVRKLLCSLGEHTPQFARPISFRPTTMCFPLFVVTRAGSIASPAPETGEAGERRVEPGACTVQVRRRRNRGENSRLFFPLSLATLPRLPAHDCTDSHSEITRRIECRFFPLFPTSLR